MPKKETTFDWQKFVNFSMEQQDIAEFQNNLKSLTGRQLYDLNTLSLMNKFLINRPINYALHRTQINYPISPMEAMKTCLLDGTVFIRVEDSTHMRIDKQVYHGEWGAFDDQLNFVEIRFIFVRDGVDFTHIEHWAQTPNGATQVVFEAVRGDVIREKELKVAFTMDFPLFPFVGIRWIDAESFLAPLKESVIRLEAAFRVIGAENIERMGLSLYLEGVRNVDDIKSAPRKMGRRVHILPKDAKFHSPSPDAPGMELMIKEIENLDRAIEKASGVVSTEKLASLSGISRQIAENPLVILSDEIRNRFAKGMKEVVETAKIVDPRADELKISFRTIKYVSDTDKQIRLIDKAVEREAITLEEEILELRLLLDLD